MVTHMNLLHIKSYTPPLWKRIDWYVAVAIVLSVMLARVAFNFAETLQKNDEERKTRQIAPGVYATCDHARGNLIYETDHGAAVVQGGCK